MDELEELIAARAGGDGAIPVLAVVSPLPEHSGPLDAVLRNGPPAGVFVVCATADSGAAPHSLFGASVVFRDPDDSDEEEWNGESAPIALTVGRDSPLFLEPITVRRDTSARWTSDVDQGESVPFVRPAADESACVGVPAVTAAEPAPLAPDEDRSSQADELPRLANREAEPGMLAEESTGRAEDPEPGDSDDVVDIPEQTLAAPPLAASSPAAPETPASVQTREADASASRQAALFTQGDLGRPDLPTTAQEPAFRVQCLGSFQVWAGDTPIERWTLEKSRELLAFLIAHGGASVAREVAAEALWEGYEWDASLKHTLSNTAATLRATLRSALGNDEVQPLVAARQRFQLPSGLFRVDLDDFDAALRRAAGLPDAEALDEYELGLSTYAADFLEGEFFTWADSYRLDYRERLFVGARRAAAIAEGIQEPGRAVPFYQAIFDREPTDEDAARGLMRCLARAGDVVGARKTFRALSAALLRELDDPSASPSAETRALLAELVGAADR